MFEIDCLDFLLLVCYFFELIFEMFDCLFFFMQTRGPNPVGGGGGGGGPVGWGPKPRKSGGPKCGGSKGGPKGGGPKFRVFFPLWGSSRGI